MKEIVAVIPVKGQSDRIESKNLRPFSDTNLYELKLSQLKKVTGFKEIIISSESERIRDIAINNFGYNVHVRDPKFSTSEVPMSDVYSYIASEISGEHIAWVNVTNPLAEYDIYEKAILEYQNLDENYDCLLSAFELKENIFYKGQPVNFKPNPWPKSQDLKDTFALSFVINILKRKDMVKWGSCVGNKPYLFVLDTLTSWDIDYQEDFDYCEMIYKNKKN